MPKKHAKSLCDALALLDFFCGVYLCLQLPCRAACFALVVIDLHLRSEGQPFILVRMVY